MNVRLVAILMFSASLGSMHGFSVLVVPIEAELGVGRGQVSLVYALALVALTTAVRMIGDVPRSIRTAPGVAIAVGLIGGAGLLMAGLSATATVGSYFGVLIGYGVVFGGANGVGYAVVLEWSASATGAGRSAMAMALATATYAVGAAGASVSLDWTVGRSGLSESLWLLAAVIVATSVGTSAVLRWTVAIGPPSTGVAETTTAGVGRIKPLWAAYGLSVLAGLMALGHAAEIIRELGASAEIRRIGVVLLTAANAVGGGLVAVAAGRLTPRRLVTILPLVSAVALAVLAATPAPVLGVAALALVGLSYGAVIAVYPAGILRLFGSVGYPAAYGRVFTAWGLAGLIGPLVAGALFDVTDSYRLPLLVAAAAAVMAAATARTAFADLG